MSAFIKLFWIVWGLIMIFLVSTLINSKTVDIVLLLILFVLTAINLYSQESKKRSFQKLLGMVERIDFKPIEEGIKKIERSNSECYLRLFKLETEIKNFKIERERKYRDVVRKVLNLDNELNKKFKLLGEAILKISKKNGEVNHK